LTGTVAISNSTGTNRAKEPGSFSRRAAVSLVFAALFTAFGFGVYGLVSAQRPGLASTASHLPRQQLDQPVDRTVVGTVASPALTVAGDYIEVKTAHFSVLAVMTGPVVPGEGLPNQMSYTTCTWRLTFSHVVGRVPISLADFDTIDHAGTVVDPYLVPGERNLPSVLTSGHRLSFQIRAIMPVGEGLMRWAPDGEHIVAKWDYQVEND